MAPPRADSQVEWWGVSGGLKFWTWGAMTERVITNLSGIIHLLACRIPRSYQCHHHGFS
jgi:hypothetical protein